MGNRFLFGLIAVAAIGIVLYVALSGGGSVPADDAGMRPGDRPDETVVAPPVVPPESGVEGRAPDGAPEGTAGATGTLAVTVTNPAKHPIAGALVKVGQREQTTGAEGTVRFEGVPVGSPIVLTARGPDPDDVPARRVTHLSPGKVREVFLTLRPGGAVRGIVYGPDGSALVAAFRVEVEPTAVKDRSQMDVEPWEISAGDGTFTLRGVPPGGYVLEVTSKGYVPGTSRPFRVEAGKTTTGIEVRLRLGGRISGVVVDRETGKPVPLASVGLMAFPGHTYLSSGTNDTAAGDPKLTADADGAFAFDGVIPGTYRVNAAAKTHVPGSVPAVTVEPGGAVDGVRLALGRGGTIQGTVFGPDGKPMPDETVLVQRVFPEFPIDGDHGLRVLTKADGTYRAAHLPAGRYRVRRPRTNRDTNIGMEVAVSGSVDAEEPKAKTPLGPDMVELAEGQVVTKDVQAVARATIRGVVVDEGGEPLREAVQLLPVKEPVGDRPVFQFPETASPDKEGKFEFPGLEPGTWRLACGGERETVVVGPGETCEVRLVLSPGRVEGVVTDPTGRPAAGVTVRLAWIRPSGNSEVFSHGTPRTETDVRGRFAFPKVDTGRYRADAGGDGTEGSSAEFDLPRGGAVPNLRIALKLLVEVRIRVLDAKGDPAKKAWVNATPQGGGKDHGKSAGADGVAVLLLPAGKHVLTAWFSGQSVTGEVTVVEGKPQEIELRVKR